MIRGSHGQVQLRTWKLLRKTLKNGGEKGDQDAAGGSNMQAPLLEAVQVIGAVAGFSNLLTDLQSQIGQKAFPFGCFDAATGPGEQVTLELLLQHPDLPVDC
jgi:hypothetical protein